MEERLVGCESVEGILAAMDEPKLTEEQRLL